MSINWASFLVVWGESLEKAQMGVWGYLGGLSKSDPISEHRSIHLTNNQPGY